jgi:hypothetical protein
MSRKNRTALADRVVRTAEVALAAPGLCERLGKKGGLCGNFIPDVDRIVVCLKYNEPNLSPACHDVFFAGAIEEPKPKKTKRR